VFHRHFVMTAASIAAGVILIPTTAYASDSSHVAVGKLTGTATGSSAAFKAAAGFKTYTSPADKSVRKQSSTVSKNAVTPAADNPTLAVALSSTPNSALGVELDADVTSADSSNTVSIAWAMARPPS